MEAFGLRVERNSFPIELPVSRRIEWVDRSYLALEPANLPFEERKRSWWSKTVVLFEGEHTIAELAIMRILERGGLQAVWARGRNSFTKVWPTGAPAELAPSAQKLHREIWAAKESLYAMLPTDEGRRGGCWDVIAWRSSEVFFIESKRLGKDKLTLSQRVWLEAALDEEHVPLSRFLVVEWG